MRQRERREGSFSDGFSTKVLPVASAIGNIHIGTIAGKLNGVIPTQTPSGCISEWLSTPVPTFAECHLLQMWDAAGKFHHFQAAGQFAHRVGEDLAVLFADDAGQARHVLFQQRLEAEHHARA
jgi:hypothetical protein